jgi:two-component system sensor histidine kinase PilS (NtrC family)
MTRTRLTQPLGDEGERLCVLFLQDQRELEARIRTDKLASMGRMSTAVAHEIRNPLAAIAQANALLEEDVVEPRLKKLTAMISQNAKRLEKIVDDILDVARVPGQGNARSASDVDLNSAIQRICTEWATHAGSQRTVSTSLSGSKLVVKFDSEHLRRVLVNLLDNAHRYANKKVDSVQVSSTIVDGKTPTMSVWSDGLPMDQSVERHLFEPFFSSESRSSGLGLYICRELCANHGASIVYQRNSRLVDGARTEGNEFMISFAAADATLGS